MKKLKKNKKGFSLVELIAAVAILAIIVVPLLQSFTLAHSMSVKAQTYSEATLAGQNILETIAARPTTDFSNPTDAKKALISEMLGANATSVTLTNLGPVDENGNFSIALTGIKSGSSTYDAKVTFERGEETNVSSSTNTKGSSGLYEINEEKIAQYSNVDAIFCQPYINTQNPDTKADEYLNASILSEFGDYETVSTERNIYIQADLIEDDGTVSVNVTYAYKRSFYKLDAGSRTGGLKTKQASFSYAILPGGYSYDEENGLGVYFMYYPWYDGTLDNIVIQNNIDGYDADDDGKYEYINMTTYLYKQKPMVYVKGELNYNGKTYKNQYVEIGYNEVVAYNASGDPYVRQNVRYQCMVTLQMPEDFQIDDETEEGGRGELSAKRFVYTNAGKIGNTTNTLYYSVQQGEGGWASPTTSGKFADEMDESLVKKEKTIRIYNIKIELYPSGSFSAGTNGTNPTFNGEIVYTLVGSKEN